MNEGETKQALLDLHRQFDEFRECLPSERARTFITITADLFASISALMIHASEDASFGNEGLAASVNKLSYRSYVHLRDTPDKAPNRDVVQVILALGAATSEAIESFDIPFNHAFNDRLLGAMLRIGRAQGALAALRSPWAKAFATGQDSDLLAAIQASRKAGGKVRAKQLQGQASDWKTEALPIAIDYDRKHPKIDRQRLAMAVLERLESRSKPGSVKSVENWLRNEVESLGLVRSRSRKKSPT